MKVELTPFSRACMQAIGFAGPLIRESDHCITIGEGGVSAVFLKRRLNGYFEMVSRRHKSPGHWLRHEFGGDAVDAVRELLEKCILLHSEVEIRIKEEMLRRYPGLTRDEFIDGLDCVYDMAGAGLRWYEADQEDAFGEMIDPMGSAGIGFDMKLCLLSPEHGFWASPELEPAIEKATDPDRG